MAGIYNFIKLWAKIGKEVLEKNISTLPGDRRKKTLTVFGELTIAKSHPFSEKADETVWTKVEL